MNPIDSIIEVASIIDAQYPAPALALTLPTDNPRVETSLVNPDIVVTNAEKQFGEALSNAHVSDGF